MPGESGSSSDVSPSQSGQISPSPFVPPHVPSLSDSEVNSEMESSTSQSASSADDAFNYSLFSEEPEESAQPSATSDILSTAALNPHDPPKLYKLVFDNIDKSVTPRDMRSDVQTRSLHYVQIYSVKSRIDFSSFAPTHELATEIIYLLPQITKF